MLFEGILIGTIFLFAIGTPILVYKAFKDGYNFGVKDYNRAHPGSEKTVPDREPKTVPQDDEGLRRMRTLLDNIDNYDGTSANQQELN